MLRNTSLAKEIENTLDQFFATATDEQFWTALEDAGWSVFSKIDLPILDYHSKATRYLVTAKQMSTPHGTHGLPGMVCYVEVEASNNNELALAA